MKRILLIAVLFIAATLSALGQTYTLCEKWVDCGNSGQLLDPYYSEGDSGLLSNTKMANMNPPTRANTRTVFVKVKENSLTLTVLSRRVHS